MWIKCITILPFETDFYKKYDVPIAYVGNPVLDAIHNRAHKDEDLETFKQRNKLDNRPIVALLAGSRQQELNNVLPVMLSTTKCFRDYQFVIAGAPSFTIKDYEPFIKETGAKVIFNETYELVQQAQGALVTSGTATLETALLDCPQVVCYKMWGGKTLTKFVKRFILKVKYISLVNLIVNKEAVKEIIQDDLNENNVKNELDKLLNNQDYRNRIFNNYKQLHTIMGTPGSSDKAAKLMVHSLKTQ